MGRGRHRSPAKGPAPRAAAEAEAPPPRPPSPAPAAPAPADDKEEEEDLPPQNLRRDGRPAFDAAEYLADPEYAWWYPAGHMRALHRYRHALYRLYTRLLRPVERPHHEEEDKRLFLHFLTHFKANRAICYGWLALAAHAWLCWAVLVRAAHCPPLADPAAAAPWSAGPWWATQTPDRAHASGRTVLGRLTWPLAWSWAALRAAMRAPPGGLALPLPGSCPARPPTLVDVVGWAQVAYYWSLLAAHYASPSAEAAITLWASPLLNGGLCAAWWFADASYPLWWLDGGGGERGAGRWRALYLPLIYFWAFCALRCNWMGLVFWAHEEANIEAAEEPEEPAAQAGTDGEKVPPPPRPSSPEGRTRRRLAELTRWCYRAFTWLSGLTLLLLWQRYLRPDGLPPELLDLPAARDPHVLVAGGLALCVMLAFGLWLSFLSFQYQFIAWTRPWREGLVVEHYEAELRIGLIY
jgi:hypothetical protein